MTAQSVAKISSLRCLQSPTGRHAHAPKKPPFYPQQRNVDAGHGFGCGGNFFPENLWPLSATSRLMLGMGFSKTLRRCGKFQGGDSVSFWESAESSEGKKHLLRLLGVFIKDYNTYVI